MLAVSGEPGTLAKPASAKVTAEVLGEGRGDKILVFHFKRKKQYKKLQGHRQNFTEVRIKAIEADGVTYDARRSRQSRRRVLKSTALAVQLELKKLRL